ncbi:MAG: lysylphosphatidylglycerol synthase domain-containing protein, partial [Bacteroidota bacterium]|nr:lysylphosphatidylglycerol synthase domain-containing protein [Bacteroidota bacterium]
MKTKIRKTYNFLLRWLIIIATYGFIYKQIFYGHDFSKILTEFRSFFKEPITIILSVICFILVFVNWGIETGKWQYLIRKIENVPYIRAYKAVLSGVAISSFTPNRIGEFMGRVFILEKANRIEGILITILGSISQFLVTFILGATGIAIFVLAFQNLITEALGITDQAFIYLYIALALASLVLFAFFLMLYLKVSVVKDFVNRIMGSRWSKLKKYTRVFSFYHPEELLKVLGYSLLRYIIFSLQF